MIEALENISKYSDHLLCNGHRSSGFCPSFKISCNDSEIEMEATNPVKNREVNPLRTRIDNVNSQDTDALKELYKTTITNGEFTAKGGAGLGFIEMAKTTGQQTWSMHLKAFQMNIPLYTFRVSMNK